MDRLNARPGAAEGLRERIFDKRVCVCAGPGGVGKTTVSAALALALAATGKRVAVVTIDPARRLAEALGMSDARARADSAKGVPVRLGSDLLARTGIEVSGELWALTLDVPATFDRLVSELSPSERAGQAVRTNRVYRELAGALAGSQEIAAVAELYDLHRNHDLDVIVLDTPPATDALQFFDTPERLAGFLDSRAISMFISANAADASPTAEGSKGKRGEVRSLSGALARALPKSIGARALGGGSAILLALFARATGVDVVGELAGFMRILAAARAPLRERALAVQRLLRDPSTTTVLISSPDPEPGRETRNLHTKLAALQMSCGGLVVNRVHPPVNADYDPDVLHAALAAPLGSKLADRMLQNLLDFDALARRDRQGASELAITLHEPDPLCLPLLSGDVEDLARLGELARILLS